MTHLVFLVFSFLICVFTFGQSISGNWKGTSEHSLVMLNPTGMILEMEVANDSMITGVIHNYYSKNRFEHIKITGKVNWKDSTVYISEDAEISHNINPKIYETCLGRMKLALKRTNNVYILKGKWKDKSNKLFRCPTLDISFVKAFDDSVYIHNPSPRTTEIQRVIELSAEEIDSVHCDLYDNGEIDDDTVSVYFNDSLIIKKQKLSDRPIGFYLSIDKSRPMQKIKLFADNLGTIPPNTALLIITTRKNRYVITLSSTYSQNGSVEFFLRD